MKNFLYGFAAFVVLLLFVIVGRHASAGAGLPYAQMEFGRPRTTRWKDRILRKK
jgi:hypothetical protein